jgi:hypothetical protein
MTQAPESLKAGRRLLLEHLDLHENTSAHSGDLDPEEVGIVGNPAHRGGYHCGKDRVTTRDYSVVESLRDRNGLTLHASALDVGWFELRVAGKTHNLRTFSIWLVARCKANTADTADIREVIYSPDGKTVKRWDRLRRRSTGDRSHLAHTHLSFFRDAIKAGRDVCVTLFGRYLTEIGLLAGEDDDVSAEDVWNHKIASPSLLGEGKSKTAADWLKEGMTSARKADELTKVVQDLAADIAEIKGQPAPGAVVIKDEQLERALRRVMGVVDDDDPPELIAAKLREQLGDKAHDVAQHLLAS